MLKQSASGVLASLRGSTYRSVRLTSSLAAALLDGLFEHPAWRVPAVPNGDLSKIGDRQVRYDEEVVCSMLKEPFSKVAVNERPKT